MADKHPNNNLKRSIGFGSAISIVIGTIIGSGIFFKQVSVVIYTLVTIGIFRFLPVGLIHRLGENTTAYLATKVFGTIGGKLLSAGIIISMMGTLNDKMLTFPRIVYAMARHGDLPFSKYLSYVTPKGKSPVVACVRKTKRVHSAHRFIHLFQSQLSQVAYLYLLVN